MLQHRVVYQGRLGGLYDGMGNFLVTHWSKRKKLIGAVAGALATAVLGFVGHNIDKFHVPIVGKKVHVRYADRS